MSVRVGETWPPLPLGAWEDTRATLHLWLQIVGKVRLALAPRTNHWWSSALYLTPRGLTTSCMPYGERALEIRFDFIDHQVVIENSEGKERRVGLRPCAVADFYGEMMEALELLAMPVRIHPLPVEVPDPIRCDEDFVHASYDADPVQRFWRILLGASAILDAFRARFIGKCSPVHFWWGSMDLSVTRFSGRKAPPREGADLITREAYSHECSSLGFWPGGGAMDGPAFYAYAAPAPAGFSESQVRPAKAFYHEPLAEFILRYDDFRQAASPREALLDFAQSTYEAAADLGKWERAALERHVGVGKLGTPTHSRRPSGGGTTSTRKATWDGVPGTTAELPAAAPAGPAQSRPD